MMVDDGHERDHTLSEKLASFVSGVEPSMVPTSAFDVAERSFVDTVGVILAGRCEEATTIAQNLSEQDSVTLLSGHDADQAGAFVNAVSGHCLDYDDCYQGGAIHPSVTVIPALLSSSSPEISGKKLLTAYVVGVEIQAHLGDILLPEHYMTGWHATSTLGTFGVAAAVATLLDLEQEEAEHALNIAASLPGGLKKNFGTTTKSVHAGQAARSGITAAVLASNGATADADAIGGTRGFVELYDGDPSRSVTLPLESETDWAILDPGIQIKKYPCCNYTHSSIEGAVHLRDRLSVPPEKIEQVTVSVSKGAVETVTHEDPTTGLEAKFSFEYTVASALAKGTITLRSFRREAIDDPLTQQLRKKVKVEVDSDKSYESLSSEITIKTDDGEQVSTVVSHPPGHESNPLSETELRNKFRRCTTREYNGERAEELFEFLRSLRSRDSVRELTGV